ncbi:MAG: hypothetical protein A3J27_08630 [Candidatus Tectomicrobia bacterium RIFCSPLOWO2_12_FULL_69_37]|nr:MAG: hypothetical protein A3J27_08630 [Candidatus Tectomicrobia bacterium RIFCSPLOWO2_12_FULL_69_37]
MILPIANALLDYLSWAASRKLVRHAIESDSRAIAVGHLLADTGLALAFLFGLALFLPMAIQGMNRGFVWVGWPAVEWDGFLEAAAAAPFSQGLMVNGMLLTTLIPTALHFLVGLTILTIRPMPGQRLMAKWVEGHRGKRLMVETWCLAAFVVSCGIFLAGCYLLWQAVALSGATVGGYLYEMALWSARLVGGPGLPPG